MRELMDSEIQYVSGGCVSDIMNIASGLVVGFIDGPVHSALNIIPNTISSVVKLSAQTLTFMTSSFFKVVGLLTFWA
ncbi:hypothetical protein AAGR22_18840 [Erwinia sp. HDF1-3R]|uniref:hypothetical protein n=1 Tax=Erwinia sp. HDF1-3R TaxID=3141543 RepID=UPI0031F49103